MGGREIARNSGSQACFQWAEKCIASCLNKHQICHQQLSVTAQLPTRVLDLEHFTDSDDLRLFESCGERGSYATLSHCWGTGPSPLTTKKATAEARRQRIYFGVLPRSFQDAVTISRALKIRYLWIDTLCIIQDSIEDWAAESGQMARIYKSSLLTISFTDCSGSHESIFCDRPELPSCRMGPGMSNIYLRSIYPYTYESASQEKPSKILDSTHSILGHSSPLGCRAWAFQERLLSPRVLSYTRDQLVWDCPHGVEREGNVAVEKAYMHMPDTEMEKAKVYRFWLGVVEVFSQCKLTFQSDKFPALSGIASEIGGLVDDTYIAGMWKSELLEALLWKPDGYSTVLPVYRAPSFSWAALDGAVKYDTLKEGYLGEERPVYFPHPRDMEVLHHYNHATTSDPLGMVDEASLTVRAYCAELDSIPLTPDSKSVETIDLRPIPIPGRNSLVLSSWKFDTRTSKPSPTRYILMQVSRWCPIIKTAVINVDDDDDSELELTGKMEIPYIAALILEETEKEGEYRRVGHAQVRDEHRGKVLWKQRELILV